MRKNRDAVSAPKVDLVRAALIQCHNFRLRAWDDKEQIKTVGTSLFSSLLTSNFLDSVTAHDDWYWSFLLRDLHGNRPR